MARKPTISGRVPEHISERVKEYAEKRDISRSKAMGQLLEAGLEAEDRRRRGEPETRTEAWCRDKFDTLAGTALLSGSACAGGGILFAVALYGLNFPSSSLVMGFLAVLVFLLGLVFAASGVGTLVTGVLLQTGWARRLDKEWLGRSDDAPST